jgi:hypothetical protein
MSSVCLLAPQNFIADENSVIEASPAMNPAYPETNIALTDRSAVTMSTSLADQALQGNWGTDGRNVDTFGVFNHKGYGGTLQLQLFQFADYSGAALYDSGVVPIVATGMTIDTMIASWDYAPLGIPPDDLLAMEAPYFLNFPAVRCASWRVTFSACKWLRWQIGTCFLGKSATAPYSPDMGMQFGWQSNTKSSRSFGGSVRTRAGARWREFIAKMHLASDADRAVWRDIYARIDSQPFMFQIFQGQGGRQERDYVALMKNETYTPAAWANVDFHELTLRFTEV